MSRRDINSRFSVSAQGGSGTNPRVVSIKTMKDSKLVLFFAICVTSLFKLKIRIYFQPEADPPTKKLGLFTPKLGGKNYKIRN